MSPLFTFSVSGWLHRTELHTCQGWIQPCLERGTPLHRESIQQWKVITALSVHSGPPAPAWKPAESQHPCGCAIPDYIDKHCSVSDILLRYIIDYWSVFYVYLLYGSSLKHTVLIKWSVDYFRACMSLKGELPMSVFIFECWNVNVKTVKLELILLYFCFHFKFQFSSVCLF